jgi:cell division protein YceG involved in septum cleavage
MTKTTVIRGLYGLVLVCCFVVAGGLAFLLHVKEFSFNQVEEENTVTEIDSGPFPVSVDAFNRTIVQKDLLQTYASESLAYETRGTNDTLFGKVVAMFSHKEWYQNLASPVSRVLVIWPGERREEVAKEFGDILGWNSAERKTFLELISSSAPELAEGKYYPGKYVVPKDANPEDVVVLIQTKFTSDILSRYTPEVESKVPLKDALTVASLLEREASDFENMREISGVIWNRLFTDMPLQLDATLQYAKANKANEKSWWPVPKPADKYIKSPFNTYSNKGLPPTPIANPSSAAVLAALNPIPTDCVYYFHDKKSNYHCSVTYEEHVRKLKQMYGRGK